MKFGVQQQIWNSATVTWPKYVKFLKFKLVGGRDIQNRWQYFNGDPLTGVECKGYEKNHDFRAISRFISQMMPDRDIVTVEGE